MKRESSAFQRIGIFKITADELLQLINEIEGQAIDRPLALATIKIETKNSTISYENLDELRHDQAWKRDIKNFKVHFWEKRGDMKLPSRTIVISGGEESDNHILVSADEEAWVVGTTDIVKEMMKKRKVWYSFFLSSFYGQVFSAFLIFAALMYLFVLSLSTRNMEPESLEPVVSIATLICALAAFGLVPVIPKRSLILESRSRAMSLQRWTILGAIRGILGLAAAVLGWWL